MRQKLEKILENSIVFVHFRIYSLKIFEGAD